MRWEPRSDRFRRCKGQTDARRRGRLRPRERSALPVPSRPLLPTPFVVLVLASLPVVEGVGLRGTHLAILVVLSARAVVGVTIDEGSLPVSAYDLLRPL